MIGRNLRELPGDEEVSVPETKRLAQFAMNFTE